MESNKPANFPEVPLEEYRSWQKTVIKFLQWGAWTAAFMAMLYVMHS